LIIIKIYGKDEIYVYRTIEFVTASISPWYYTIRIHSRANDDLFK